MSSDADFQLGPVLSTHRAKITSIVWMALLCAFSLAVAIALVVVARKQTQSVEVWKRLGGAALFFFAAGALAWWAWMSARTSVELARDGFRYSRGEVVVVRWGEVEHTEVTRINGNTTVVLTARGKRLVMGHTLSDFELIVETLQARGLWPPGIAP